MHLWQATSICLLAAAAAPAAAADWGFADATVAVQPKGAGVNGGFKEQYESTGKSSMAYDQIEANSFFRSAKRPHQAFLLLKDTQSGLDVSYPFTVKENGKSRVELTQKDLPIQFLSLAEPVDARVVLGSFGSSTPYDNSVFSLSIERNPDVPVPTVEVARYGKQPQIHHIFKDSPTSPPVAITLAFVGLVLAALPLLGGFWLLLGANVKHLPAALQSAPLPHAFFLGSLVAFEGLFFLYYTSWNLFQTLPAAAAIGAVAFVSGSRALGEVQGRRLAGLR
ncbi:hypothetical protein N7470_010393 [Penicillium chermesinum]|nr:hypothetical protein N7470_010393 [Penicillium chermesinum]